MSDPTILFVKPKAISRHDKKLLSEAGVVVIEIENPQDAKLTKAGRDFDGHELLRVAMRAIAEHSACPSLSQKVVAAMSNLLSSKAEPDKIKDTFAS